MYRLRPLSEPSTCVRCNVITEVYYGAFVSPNCPCSGCAFFHLKPSFGISGFSITRHVLNPSKDPTSFYNFASIDTLTDSDDVSNANIVHTDTPTVETLPST